MDAAAVNTLRIGDWYADPLRSTLTRGSETIRVDSRCMRLLVCLAREAGQVMSIEKLLDEVWEGVVVSPDSVYQAVASLRRQLGDDPKNPAYIATVPRLGYRMVAAVSSIPDDAGPIPPDTPPPKSRLRPIAAAALLLIPIGLAVFLYANRAGGPPPPQSVAVLPFTDLTSQAMDEEYFADGMTEELIDRLSHIPGVRVPAATSSFAFKGRKLSITDIGKALGVAYILDGSVRESESTMRITARLARVEDGYVVWSQSYDRPTQDKLKTQEDIAREVAASLTASVKP